MDFDLIREEQKRIRQKVEDFREDLIERGREGVETQGYVKATVIAWPADDLNVRYFYPEWEDEEDRDRAFSNLKKLLKEHFNARATLTMTNGVWTVDGEDSAAIIIIGRTPNWSEMTVLPHETVDGQTVWGEREDIEDFTGGFVRVPQEA